ncbi:MAG: serine/threonine-protein kinase [Myxococcales bacterium]|nr:serine/threonine-protein kinase [Myxococcales bacterium]
MAGSPVQAVEVPSRRFGRYIIRSRLGQGGMAEVFLAEAVDEKGDQLNVALKLMRKGVPEDKFADEADLMGLLSHPNLVRMLEVGAAFGRPFIAMEFLIGGDLREVMEAHRRQMKGFPLGMGVHLCIEVLRALAYFHTATTRTGTPLSLVHSDVNPANVFFSGAGEVKLGDFGVASSGHIDIGPGEGITAGKLSYLSPEQIRGEPLGPAADLWSVGVMMHELIVGYHPFQKEGASEQEIMQLIRSAKLNIPDYVDKPLAVILQKALTPDLRQRYRSAGEFAGPLFAWALDHNHVPTNRQLQEWLESVLGLLV